MALPQALGATARARAGLIGRSGSYTNRSATQASDVDFLVEFDTHYVSLIKLSGFKLALEESLGVAVDVIHIPISDNSLLDV
jgi:predicted nucleotidyltransferase